MKIENEILYHIINNYSNGYDYCIITVTKENSIKFRIDLRKHRWQMVVTHNTKKCRSGAGMARLGYKYPSGYKYDANGKCRWFLKNRKKLFQEKL